MIPLYKPFMPETPQINEILKSGQLAYGKYGRAFEEQLSHYFETSNVLVTNTFNMAILVALTTLDVKAGDTVIVSPMACLASTQPLLSIGVIVQWADVDPMTGTLSPESVRSLMNIKPKAIIHNHYCGYPGHIDEINAIGNEFGIPVIDDGIEAFGSEYKGKKIGNVGSDVTIFSFNPVRIPNTLDGGAVIFKDDKLFEKSKLIRDAGIDRTQFRDNLGEISPNCDITMIGHSATPMEINTYIGTQQMENVDSLLSTQRENAKLWKQWYASNLNGKPIENHNSNPNFWVFGILAEDKIEMIKEMRSKGYYASGVHINNNIYSVFGKSDFLPGVEYFSNHFVAVPSGWWVDLKDELNV
ncbi:DegT/DnrJ/EryC1/StrS family aminotransferase [Chryseobacterium formosus]|uniref:DegT/DnrJ/EryC1/StrS family aminotransferase n=1 Tax=Chryseobacterium formosus TaxID=1537363 RepID=A0ABT3XQA7_9FLAO|nr:DegT/DnrJ/EryC1/StrS family aminotransferase [Chryseobacterium formosus]MCX8523528.1 DegT/DnrJ/EryC1/StrS family aminotransferase [Chryseobacterium formosus]